MNIYRITEQERDLLESCNTSEVLWLPTKDEDGFFIDEKTLNNPAFSSHKDVFDSFPPKTIEEKVEEERIGP